jgi:hypothetical protein
MAIRGRVVGGPPSSGTGGSKVEPSSRRAIEREPPPMSWRKTAQANEPSSSTSMSIESARPPPWPPRSVSEASCGKADGFRPVTRRAYTRARPSAWFSPQPTIALPSAETATDGRWVPRPAARAGSMSNGAPTVVQPTSCRRATRMSEPPPPGAAQAA